MIIYYISRLANKAFPRAMTLINTQSAFRVTDIYLFPENTFSDEDYFPSDEADCFVSISVFNATEYSTTSFTGVTLLTPRSI